MRGGSPGRHSDRSDEGEGEEHLQTGAVTDLRRGREKDSYRREEGEGEGQLQTCGGGEGQLQM